MPENKNKLVGLIGYPVGHSISPVMHNAAFTHLGMNWQYHSLPTPPDELETQLSTLPDQGYQGFNVTIPHKESVIPYLNKLDRLAKKLGAVNTIVVKKKAKSKPHLHGYNTDIKGFSQALLDSGYFPFKRHHAVVVGAGGAARAVLFALIELGIGRITLLNRSLERARKIVDLFSSKRTTIDAEMFDPGKLVESARSANLLVNATPLGTWPDTDRSIWPDSKNIPPQLIIFDLVYNPIKTKLLGQAERSNALAVSGLDMLVYQGASSFEMWTGVPAPVDVMRDACLKAIGGQHA